METVVERIRHEVRRRVGCLLAEYEKLDRYEVTRTANEKKLSAETLENLLPYLDYLIAEQKKVDLEKEIDEYFFHFTNPETGEKLNEEDCSLSIPQARKLIHHFYALGLIGKYE